MFFQVSYERKGNPCGHPDRAKSILEARLIAPEGRLHYKADSSILVSLDDDGNEKLIEKIKL
jgi:hypothetical protein